MNLWFPKLFVSICCFKNYDELSTVLFFFFFFFFADYLYIRVLKVSGTGYSAKRMSKREKDLVKRHNCYLIKQTISIFLRNPGRDISFTISIRKEIETRKLERKSKQKISRLIDLLYRLNDIISR